MNEEENLKLGSFLCYFSKAKGKAESFSILVVPLIRNGVSLGFGSAAAETANEIVFLLLGNSTVQVFFGFISSHILFLQDSSIVVGLGLELETGGFLNE